MSPFPPRPADCTGLIIDVGCNDGSDALAWLSSGYCVLSVDANPQMTQLTASKAAQYGDDKVHVLTAGLEEQPGNVTFWIAEDPVHSSFDAHHANHAKKATPVSIPTVRCDSLWQSLTMRPHYLKIDIEERHFTCVRALAQLKRSQLPLYVSWERHAKTHDGLPNPLFDASLVLSLQTLGYREGKVIHGHSLNEASVNSPEEAHDGRTNSSSWIPVPHLFVRGFAPGRGPNQHAPRWWDFLLKLDQ